MNSTIFGESSHDFRTRSTRIELFELFGARQSERLRMKLGVGWDHCPVQTTDRDIRPNHLWVVSNLPLASIVFALSLISLISSTAIAQSVCLPMPRLLTTMPMGGPSGTQIDVTITGENIESANAMVFNHPGLTALPKLDANGQPVPNTFTVSIAKECPTGVYESRVMSKLGISSSRVFSVDTLPEVQQTPNTSLAKAMELGMNSICNAAMTAKSVDHYSFQAKKDHRYVVFCSARGIDSKLDPVVIIADESGRDLVVERRGDILDYTAKSDGRHIIKVHELTFKGGPAFFYRLSLQEVGIDSTLPQFASTKTVSSFSWPPNGLAAKSSIAESEPNNLGSQSQKISLPCDLSGAFYPAADVDTFEFTATKGDVWWVEVASERLGRPTDPSILVQHVSVENGIEKLTDVAEFTDIASPMKPSSNGYAYDGPPYDGGSTDILSKLEIKQDGIHRLQLRDLFGGTRVDLRNVYRIVLRQAAPDFALAAWGLHMELRNGDRNALSKPLALRCGSTIALEVVAVRRDGFNGDIQLELQGLPDGVSAQGLKIPAGKSRGIMLITANQEAPPCLSKLSFHGKSSVEGVDVTRPVHMAQMAWPIVDAWGEIPSPRLMDDILLSVSNSEVAPISIAAKEKTVIEGTVGEKLKIPLNHAKRMDFSGSVLQLKALGDGFEQIPRFDVSLDAATSEATVDLAALKTLPGEYTLAFYGSAVVKYKSKPDATPQDVAEIVITEPISIRVKPSEKK